MTLHFPIDLNKFRGLPINTHPGAFGRARKHNVHEGVDLYGEEGDKVFAICDGTVILNDIFTGGPDCPWWLSSNALLVEDGRGFYVYGEITSNLKVGDRVKSGQHIANIVPVLPAHKFRPDIPGHSVNMLHLERYDDSYDLDEEGWANWLLDAPQPSFLKDPTPELLSILHLHNSPLKILTLQ